MRIPIKIAVNREDREKGFMFVESADYGILFVNDYPSRLGLWMKNTHLPLSSAFLDANGKILKIHPFMEPHSRKIYASPEPADYMLEVPMIKDDRIFVLFGPPASGKGTQAELISQEYGYLHLSAGDILRAGEYPPKYKEMVEKSLTQGILLRDEVISEIFLGYLEKIGRLEGLILDGYPRTVGQAEDLKDFLEEREKEITAVFYLDVPEEELLRRMLGRGRKDDTTEVFQYRLKVYREQTEPLKDYYTYRLVEIEAGENPEKTFAQIREKLDLKIYEYRNNNYLSVFDLQEIEEGDKIRIDFRRKQIEKGGGDGLVRPAEGKGF